MTLGVLAFNFGGPEEHANRTVEIVEGTLQ